MRKSGNIKLPGYQIFQLNLTSGLGGGLLSALDESLNPVLVSAGDDEVELLVVQIKVGHLNARVFNAYGSQEEEMPACLKFWHSLEKEIIKAKQENCGIKIQMDANAKLESEIQELSRNGQYLLDLASRQNLKILNNSEFCKGKITRHRITKNKVEKSILDYILVCDILSNYFTSMLIDEERLFTLTKFVSTRGVIKPTKSDHNILYCSFNLTYKKEILPQRRQEIFNLKNRDCQEAFTEETENTNKFTEIFNKEEPFEKKTMKFQRCLNQSIRKCFRKVRVMKKDKETELDRQLELWSKLKIFLKNSECEKSITVAKRKFNKLDQIIQEECSLRNVKIVEDHIANFSINGNFSSAGMWKLRSKLRPKQLDPPMAKIDKGGNIITAPSLLRKLYLDTYVDRLRHREMKPELMEVFNMKMTLWDFRLELLKENKSRNWQEEDLNKVLKGLKNNKSRDPGGLINEIFKPNVIGSNLRDGLLHLSNGIKTDLHFPPFMQLANVTTIYKKKGSRLSLENDRGIFVTSVMKKIIDRLIYNDKYSDIDDGMSDSNIGGRKNKNIKNHLFVIYGILNSVINGEDDPIDIQVYDLEKAFDALWLEDCMNDLVDTLPISSHDDKVALIYEANMSNLVARSNQYSRGAN